MTKTRKLSLIAVLTFFSAISLPRSSCAQDSYFGTWSGVASFTDTEYLNGQISGVTTGSIPAMFGFSYYPSVQISSISIYTDNFTTIASLNGYDPQSLDVGGGVVSGTIYGEGAFEVGPSIGNFSVSYQSILPDGFIDTVGGSAVADITLLIGALGTTGTGEVVFASFQSQTVPEPSSIVQVYRQS